MEERYLAFTADLRPLDFAIYDNDFTVQYPRVFVDENYRELIKKKVNDRNKRKARCRIGASRLHHAQ